MKQTAVPQGNWELVNGNLVIYHLLELRVKQPFLLFILTGHSPRQEGFPLSTREGAPVYFTSFLTRGVTEQDWKLRCRCARLWSGTTFLPKASSMSSVNRRKKETNWTTNTRYRTADELGRILCLLLLTQLTLNLLRTLNHMHYLIQKKRTGWWTP